MTGKEDGSLEKFVVHKKLIIGPVRIETDKVSAPYTVIKKNGAKAENILSYVYEDKVFDPLDPSSQNLASIIVAQVALNYGLFFEEINLNGLYSSTDRRFLNDMMENTSREIVVNKLLMPNEFLKNGFQQNAPVQKKKYTAATLTFINTNFKSSKVSWHHWPTDRSRMAILSSGGKDSLLTYGVTHEVGYDVHPVFINESGRHWFTALNAYRYFRDHEPNTVRVWCNSDRIFNWMLRQMPFIRENFNQIRSDMYPLRLWTVAVFLFGVLPIAKKRGIGNILIGNEYDTTVKSSFHGITHYNGLYDQSKYFDNALTRYYLKKGWLVYQYSVLRSLSELLIMKIIVRRYPELQAQQISCHAAHEEGGRVYPCGKCEKCRRIVGMLAALGEDPQRCGYNSRQIEQCLKSFSVKTIKQLGSDSQHLFYLLHKKRLIEDNQYIRKNARRHDYILKLRFDQSRSMPEDIPESVRRSIFKLYLEHADGSVRYNNRRWEDFNILQSPEIDISYHFGIHSNMSDQIMPENHYHKEYLWEHLSWPELEDRLKEVDTALLPCGSIEQHGPHLPVDVDYFDASYLARKVAEACSKPKPFVLPPVPYGVSYHHEDFKGTISVTNEGLSRFIYDIGMSLARNGIKKLILINGHGDNAPTLNFSAQMINRDAGIFVCVDTGESSDKDIDEMAGTHNDIHAGEIETSTSMALRPSLVKMEKAKKATPEFASSYLDYSSSRGVPWYVRTRKISESGIIGDPTRATAQKGQKIWEIMVAHLVKFVEEIKSSKLDDLYQKKY